MTHRLGVRTVVVAVATVLLAVPTAAQALWSATATLSLQVTARTMTPVGDVECADVDGGVLLSWSASASDSAPSYVVRADGGDYIGRTAEKRYEIQSETSIIDLLFGLIEPSHPETTMLWVYASGLSSDSGSRSGWESAGSSVTIHTESSGPLGLSVVVRCG